MVGSDQAKMRPMFVFRLPQGTYQEKPKLPFVPGSEVSGVVTEVADDVHSVKVKFLTDGETHPLSLREDHRVGHCKCAL